MHVHFLIHQPFERIQILYDSSVLLNCNILYVIDLHAQSVRLFMTCRVHHEMSTCLPVNYTQQPR